MAELISPNNGDTLSNTSATLKWQPAIDPDGDTVRYQVVYCEEPTLTGCTPVQVSLRIQDPITLSTMLVMSGSGTGLLLLGFMLPAKRRRISNALILLAIGITLLSCSDAANQAGDTKPTTEQNTSFPIESLSPDSVYYWKVISSDDAGATTDSEIWSFRTGAL